MSDMFIDRNELEKEISRNLKSIVEQTVSEAISSGIEEGIKDTSGLSPSTEKSIEKTFENINDVIESTLKKSNKELKSMLEDSFNEVLSDLAKNKVNQKTQSDFAASFSAALLKGLDISDAQARVFGELTSISDKMSNISEKIQDEIVSGVGRTSKKLTDNISFLENLRDLGSEAVNSVKLGMEESTKKTRKRSFSIEELFEFDEDKLLDRINTLFEKAADGSTEQVKNLIASVSVALARGLEVADDIQLAIGGPSIGDPYVGGNVDKKIENYKQRIKSEIDEYLAPKEEQTKVENKRIEATKEYLLELKNVYNIWDSLNDKQQNGEMLSPDEEQKFDKARESIKEFNETYKELVVTLKNGEKLIINDYFDDWDKITKKNVKSVEGVEFSQKTIDSYKQLKEIIKEMEEIYSKIERGTIKKQFGDYADFRTSSNLVDISDYNEDEYSVKNMEYLKNKIKETYSAYKKLESAIKNSGGFFKGERYDDSELEKLKNVFGYLIQEYYDFQKRFELDGLLDSEGIENIDNIVSKMTKKFKEFVSVVKNNSDSVSENNKLYQEEQERLDESNKSLVERYNILRELVVSKLADSGVDDETKYFIQDIIPFFSDFFEDWSSLQNFGTKLFDNDIKYDVLLEVAKALGFINKELVEYKKNIKGFDIKKASRSNQSPRLRVQGDNYAPSPAADYEDYSSVSMDENKVLDTIKKTKELEDSAEKTAEAVDKENEKLDETSEKAEKAAKGKKKTTKANKELKKAADETSDSVEEENEELKKLQEQKKQEILNNRDENGNKILRQIDYADGNWEFIERLQDGQTRSMFYRWSEELQEFVLSVGNVDTVFSRLENEILKLDKQSSELRNKIVKNSKNPTYDPTSDQNKRNQLIAEANRLYKILNNEYSENIAYEYRIEQFQQERLDNQRRLNELTQSSASTQNFGAAKNYENLGKQLSKYYELAIKNATNYYSMTVDEIQLFDRLYETINRARNAQDEFAHASDSLGNIIGNNKSRTAYNDISNAFRNEINNNPLKSYILEVQEEFNNMIEKINNSSRSLNFSDSVSNDLNELETRINSLMESFSGNDSHNNLVALGNEIDSIRAKIQEVDKTARSSNGIQASAEQINDKLKAIERHLHSNSAMSNELKEEFRKLSDEYTILLASKEPQSAVEELNLKFKKLEVQLERSGRTGKSMIDRMVSSLKTANAQLLSMYLSWMDLFRYGRQLVSAVVDIDTSITELRKVSDASDLQLSHALQTATKDAKELGSAINDVIQIQSDWARLGYTVEESENLARVTTLFKSIGDNMDAESASQYMVSTLQGFQKTADEALDIVNKYNEVSNNFAIDTAGIGEALQKSAASFNAANTDLSKSIALITATNEVVQNPSTVGTLWKTMSARIRGRFVPIYNENYSPCYV